MPLIEEIKSKLSKYPAARYQSNTSSISVLPNSTDGFAVDIVVNGNNHYTVSFNGWHEDFEDEDEAKNVFAFGLSDECRLKECRRGSFAYKWTLESLEHGEWIEQSTTGLLIFPFWKKASVHYLQNNLLSRSDAEKTP